MLRSSSQTHNGRHGFLFVLFIVVVAFVVLVVLLFYFYFVLFLRERKDMGLSG